ncbi:ZIP family metal transporter [Paenibacillus sp. HB172176]|uniref:ZIP family metal transporter n=1 Tax=Paenibacillus sp. HB172176 TaxID=2493690 RepID=UPI001439273C|nr:ZIP family metal transporter [Paenibacillus sp. HB172176]
MDNLFLGAAASSAATALGAVPILFLRRMSHRGKDVLLAFTAGIMVAASTYGLIPSALKLSNLAVLVIGIILGTAVLTLLETYLPHADLEHAKENDAQDRSRAMLFLVAMAIHNLPEGLSVGVSYASDPDRLGPLVSLAMGLQNVPEGFLIGLFLLSSRMSRGKAFLYASMTGGVELISALCGLQFAAEFSFLVPYGLAFAAGAMLFVVYKELIPESHGDGNELSATISFIAGLLAMIGLTYSFG